MRVSLRDSRVAVRDEGDDDERPVARTVFSP